MVLRLEEVQNVDWDVLRLALVGAHAEIEWLKQDLADNEARLRLRNEAMKAERNAAVVERDKLRAEVKDHLAARYALIAERNELLDKIDEFTAPEESADPEDVVPIFTNEQVQVILRTQHELQTKHDASRTECDKLRAEVMDLRSKLADCHFKAVQPQTIAEQERDSLRAEIIRLREEADAKAEDWQHNFDEVEGQLEYERRLRTELTEAVKQAIKLGDEYDAHFDGHVLLLASDTDSGLSKLLEAAKRRVRELVGAELRE